MDIMQKLKIFSYQQFYSEKNKSIFNKTLYMIMFILGSFFVSIIILQMLGYDGARAIAFIFTRPFNSFIIKDFVLNLSILGISGLAFAVGYKSGIFNIGISGQMMASGLVMTYIAKALTMYDENDMPVGSALGDFGWLFLIFIGFLTGALVAVISGLLKMFFKIHEVISTIMINWIIFFIFKFLTMQKYLRPDDSSFSTIATHESFAVNYIIAIVLLIVLAVFFFVLFKFTIFGKKISSVGKSIDASAYSGYKNNLIQLTSFAISGGLAGILALIVYSKSGTTLSLIIPLVNILPLEGFNGIAISMVAFSNPISIIPISFFFSMISVSSLAAAPFPNSLGDFIIGLIMYGTAIFALAYQIKLLEKIKKLLLKIKWFKNSYWLNKQTNDTNSKRADIQKLISDCFIEKIKSISVINNEIDTLNNEIKTIKKSNISDTEKNQKITQLSQAKTKYLADKKNIVMKIDKKFLSNYEKIQIHWKNLKNNYYQNNLGKENI